MWTLRAKIWDSKFRKRKNLKVPPPNTNQSPNFWLHRDREGRLGYVPPSVRWFFDGFECFHRKYEFPHLWTTKKSHFSISFEVFAPRLLPRVHRSVDCMKILFFGTVLSIRYATTQFRAQYKNYSQLEGVAIDRKGIMMRSPHTQTHPKCNFYTHAALTLHAKITISKLQFFHFNVIWRGEFPVVAYRIERTKIMIILINLGHTPVSL